MPQAALHSPETKPHTTERTVDSITYDGDPAVVAKQLSRRKNLDRVLDRFDNNDAGLRDVAGFTRRERAAVLELGRQSDAYSLSGRLMERSGLATTIESTVLGFNDIMHDQTGYAHDLAGYNFAVFASMLRDKGYEWATNLDTSLGEWLRVPHGGLDVLVKRGRYADSEIREHLTDFAFANKVDMAWYLAEQSQHSEDQQRELFAGELIQAKRNARQLVHELAGKYGLPQEYVDRAMAQLERTDFSAFDQMAGGITSTHMDTLGDYVAGTFRIEVKLGDLPFRFEFPDDPLGTVQHELFHATSAQDIEGRLGLQAPHGIGGMQANEGMTELFTQLSLGRVTHKNGKIHLDKDTAYRANVKAAYHMMRHDEKQFKTLVHGYFGHAPSEKALTSALKTFQNWHEYFETNSSVE